MILRGNNTIEYNYLEVYCEWGSWSMSLCDKSWDGGIRTRFRSKTKIEVGTSCDGESKLVERCNTAKCDEKSRGIFVP